MNLSLLSHKHKSRGDDQDYKNHLKILYARHQLKPWESLVTFPQKWRRILFSVLWTIPPWLLTVYKNWSFGSWLEKHGQTHGLERMPDYKFMLGVARNDLVRWAHTFWVSSREDTKHSNNIPPPYCLYHN